MTKKFVLEALKWGGAILFTTFIFSVGCVKKEDPVKKYIQTLENNKDAFLDREKESICFEAIYGLRSYRDDKRVVPALIKVLEENDSHWVQKLATSSLGEIKDPRAVPMLGRTLTGRPNADVCISAAWALGEICDPKAVPYLIDAFTVKKEQLEKTREVTTGGGREMYQEFIDRYDEIREAIATALEKIDQKHNIFPSPDIDIYPIIELLGNPWSSFQSARLLGIMRDKRAVPALIRILNNPERYFEIPSYAYIVGWALGEIGDTSAIPVLIIARDYISAYSFVEAVGKIRDKRALPYVIEYSKDKDPFVRYKATEALVKIAGEEHLPGFLKLLKELLKDRAYYDREQVRDIVAQSLGELKEPRTIPVLMDAIREDREFAGAVRALGEIGDTTVLSFLDEVSKDTVSSSMAKSAQEAIDKIKSGK